MAALSLFLSLLGHRFNRLLTPALDNTTIRQALGPSFASSALLISGQVSDLL